MLRKFLLKHRMKRKIKKAFEPYHKGEKTFLECQTTALISLLGKPFEEVKTS